MNVIEAIKSRRSVREFTDEGVTDTALEEIIDAGRWAPSGLNNQAWKFIVVRDEGTKEKLSGLTHYGSIIKNAPVLIAVFLDKNEIYDRTKDVQSIGACIQNMLLAIHSMDLGAVWLGEILKMKEDVNSVLGAPEYFELMAVVALGYPVMKKRSSERKELRDLVFRERFGQVW
ncbi:MAG: nitroreductase family protein [Euryarchaeota archaeon]|nr:nitroreductase family protein [Euryarchaeota archaeon]